MNNKDKFLHIITEYSVFVFLAITITITFLAVLLDRTLYSNIEEEKYPFLIKYYKTSINQRNENEISFNVDTSVYTEFMYKTFGVNTDVYIDDVLVYKDDLEPYTVAGLKWHRFCLDESITNSGNHNIRVTFYNKHDSSTISKIPIVYGFYLSNKNIIYKVLQTEMIQMIVSSIMVILGIILILFYFINKKNHTEHHTLYLGILSIVVSIWEFVPTVLFQTILPYNHARGILFICCIMLYPLTFFAYSESRFNKVKSNITVCHTMIIIIFGLLLILDIFHIEQVILLYFLLTATEGILYTNQVLTQWMSIKRKRNKWVEVEKKLKDEDENLQKEYKVLVVQSISIVIIAILNVFICNTVFISRLIETVAVISIICRFMKECTIVIEVTNDSNSVEMYKRIALIDSLTGLKNRQAFNFDIKEVDTTRVCIVSFDVNNLKYHNDTFGHKIGDKLLRDSASLLQNVYGENNVYRFGGDEFVALLIDTDENQQNYLKRKMNNICNKFNSQSKDVKISIATGYAFYSKVNNTIDKILSEADEYMYKDKAYLKSIGVAFDPRDFVKTNKNEDQFEEKQTEIPSNSVNVTSDSVKSNIKNLFSSSRSCM